MSTYRETPHSDGEPSPDDEQPKRNVGHTSRSDEQPTSRPEADPYA